MFEELIILSIAAIVIALLAYVMFRIGQAMTTCPDTGRVARAGTATILTTFACVTFGIAFLATVWFKTYDEIEMLTTIGFLLIAFGIGFAIAIGQLQSVVLAAANRIAEAKTAPAHQA